MSTSFVLNRDHKVQLIKQLTSSQELKHS